MRCAAIAGGPTLIFGATEVMSSQRFEGLRTISIEPRAWPLSTPETGKVLLGQPGRWHLVERQYQFGAPVYFAREIVIRLTSAEAVSP